MASSKEANEIEQQQLVDELKKLIRIVDNFAGFAKDDLYESRISKSKAMQQWYVKGEDFEALPSKKSGKQVVTYKISDVIGQAVGRHGTDVLLEKIQQSKEKNRVSKTSDDESQYVSNKKQLFARYLRDQHAQHCDEQQDAAIVKTSRDTARAFLEGNIKT